MADFETARRAYNSGNITRGELNQEAIRHGAKIVKITSDPMAGTPLAPPTTPDVRSGGGRAQHFFDAVRSRFSSPTNNPSPPAADVSSASAHVADDNRRFMQTNVAGKTTFHSTRPSAMHWE